MMGTREPGRYVGRFAPSPTGPLHFGSLAAAVASYLQAKVNNGVWLLRIENIDPPREQPGASEVIIEALRRYGFQWDDDIRFQSDSRVYHDAAVNELINSSRAYRCGCSRKDLASAARSSLGTLYPGTCRAGTTARDAAIRVLTDNHNISFDDRLQGTFTQRLESESGDFVIQRRDGLIAYQLAVVVDDARDGVTEIVRGIDLIESTPRQIWLQQLLGFNTPRYMHLPVITHANGDKLSKLTGAAAISIVHAERTLVEVLVALEQDPPREIESTSIDKIWQWATENWQPQKLYAKRAILHPALDTS